MVVVILYNVLLLIYIFYLKHFLYKYTTFLAVGNLRRVRLAASRWLTHARLPRRITRKHSRRRGDGGGIDGGWWCRDCWPSIKKVIHRAKK